ncbi:hypothetical protein ACOMHN_059703 [Nucella lapillus]
MDRTGVGTVCLWIWAVIFIVHGQNHYVNVARGRTYNQSSKWLSIDLSSQGANGDTDSDYPANCIHTLGNGDLSPWWEVDLGQPYPVYNIDVWARTGCQRRVARVGNLLPPHCLTRVEHGNGFSDTSTQEDHPPLASRGNFIPPQDVTGVQHGNGFSETTTRSAILQLTSTGNLLPPHREARMQHGVNHTVTSTLGGAPVSGPPPGTGASRDQCQRDSHVGGRGGISPRDSVDATVRGRRESTRRGGDSLCRHSDGNSRAARGRQKGNMPRKTSPDRRSARDGLRARKL